MSKVVLSGGDLGGTEIDDPTWAVGTDKSFVDALGGKWVYFLSSVDDTADRLFANFIGYQPPTV